MLSLRIMIDDSLNDQLDREIVNDTHAVFVCPKCNVIDRDEVIFLCNKCSVSDLLYKDGIYMCPTCLLPGQNFECMKCGSKEVKAKFQI